MKKNIILFIFIVIIIMLCCIFLYNRSLFHPIKSMMNKQERILFNQYTKYVGANKSYNFKDSRFDLSDNVLKVKIQSPSIVSDTIEQTVVVFIQNISSKTLYLFPFRISGDEDKFNKYIYYFYPKVSGNTFLNKVVPGQEKKCYIDMNIQNRGKVSVYVSIYMPISIQIKNKGVETKFGLIKSTNIFFNF